jgi:photosystem II stability/assembly factor-like uncharacterized protein
MKKIVLFIVIVFFAGVSFSNPVTQNEAVNLATNFMKFQAGNLKTNFDVSNVVENKKNDLTTFYIINFKEGGFVIISADDRVEPILGYSATNSIPKEITNTSFQSWLNTYNSQIEYAVNNDLKSDEYSVKWSNLRNSVFSKGTKDVAPLIATTWDQDGAYNDACPSGTYTGCVATCMAQIMNFWEYPVTGKSSNTYNQLTYNTLYADFSDIYDWDAIPDAGSVTSANAAIAELMFEAGVSVNMDYGTDGSGAMSADVPFAMANYFQYDQSTIKQIIIGEYATNDDWTNAIKADLDLGRPVYYSGSSPSYGHAFVCDGYNATGLHFNFGWSGYGNGYFAVGAINPVGETFNETNAAVIGIQPGDEEQDMLWVNKYTDFGYQSAYPGYICGVNESVAWATGRDGSGGQADYKIFTRTIDGGLTWTGGEFTTYGTAYSMIYGLSATTAYIAVYGTGATGNRVIKTTDGGTTWASVLQGAGASSFFNVVHFFDNQNGLVQGDPDTEFEIYTTSNEGANWTRVPGENIPAPVAGEYGIVGMYTAIADTIWFTTNRGRVYKSEDKGLNWQVYAIANTGTSDTNIEIAFDDEAQNGICDLYNATSTTHTLYRTTDGGETWTEVTPVGNYYSNGISAVPGLLNTFVSAGAWVTDATAAGISYSEDGGLTWTNYADMYSTTYASSFITLDMVSPAKGFAGDWSREIETGVSEVASGGMWVFGAKEPLVANFIPQDVVACMNTDFVFTSSSTGNILTYDWNFGENAVPATATTPGPHTVQYTTPGYKTASLTVTDSETSSTLTLNDHILVAEEAPALIDTIYGPQQVLKGTTNTYSIYYLDYTDYTWTKTGTLFTFISVNQDSIELKAPNFVNMTTTLSIQTLNGCGESNVKSINITTVNEIAIDETSTLFEIYPNPANEKLYLVSDKEIQSIEIYNIAGQKISSINVNSSNYNLNVSDFEAGMYIINLNIDNETVTRNIIVE